MRFTALRTLATLLKLIAVLEGAVGLVIAGKAASAADGSALVFFAAASSVAFKVLVTYAVAEAIGVFLAIEENTRKAATTDAGTSKKRPVELEEGDEPEAPPPARDKASRFVTCESCGKKTESDSRFCQKCGKPMPGDE